jgi:hypothetical protein
MQGGVKSALLDLKNFVRDLLNTFGDGPAVLGLRRFGFEDEKIDRASDRDRLVFPYYVYLQYGCVDSQGIIFRIRWGTATPARRLRSDAIP